MAHRSHRIDYYLKKCQIFGSKLLLRKNNVLKLRFYKFKMFISRSGQVLIYSEKKNFKKKQTLWLLFMDGAQLPQG